MDKMNDFKNIADEMMSDINAGEDLKRRTLAQCKKKNNRSFGKVLIPAACLFLTFGLLNLTGVLPLKSQTAKEENTEINILLESTQDSAKGTESTAENATSSILQDNGDIKTWTISTTEEAGKSFGSALLLPEYVPGEFHLDQIQASGATQTNADNITLTYIDGDKLFHIMEVKTDLQEMVLDGKVITIHGLPVYINSLQTSDKAEIDSMYTELQWFKEGVLYSISGQITEEEAVEIAENMSEQ